MQQVADKMNFQDPVQKYAECHSWDMSMVRKNGEFGKLIPEKYWYVEGNCGIWGEILPFCT